MNFIGLYKPRKRSYPLFLVFFLVYFSGYLEWYIGIGLIDRRLGC